MNAEPKKSLLKNAMHDSAMHNSAPIYTTVRLGVNLDHVATVRQARGEFYPSLTQAAEQVILAGADQITLHLREDRRHVQDHDLPAVQAVCQKFHKPLNMEMSLAPEIVTIACHLQPEWICLVPEKREERTTEGGLNLKDKKFVQRLVQVCRQLKQNSATSKISLFIEADASIQEVLAHLAREQLIDAVEIHTGDYAKKYLSMTNEHHPNLQPLQTYLQNFANFAQIIHSHNLGYHAGHGLTANSLQPLLELNIFAEYNIGHWIIAQALFDGLSTVVGNLKKLMIAKK